MLEKSAVAEHAWENHRVSKLEKNVVIDQDRGPKVIPLKEAFHNQTTPAQECFNQDGGLEHPDGDAKGIEVGLFLVNP